MTQVAVLGGGAGGSAAAVELTQRGYRVRLWNRRSATIEPFHERGIGFEGVLGSGRLHPELITTHLATALDGVEAVVVSLPALAHGALAVDLAELNVQAPIVLNPGHTGGALHFARTFESADADPPPLCELSTLTYVARRQADQVAVTGRAGRVYAACLPGGVTALDLALEMFPGTVPVDDVLATSLANVNLVLHPPGALLGASWVEATGGDFTFYVEGMTPGVARVLGQLDAERRAVAGSFGHQLPDILQEMAGIGTVEPEDATAGDIARAIRRGRANARIAAPDSLDHRYYTEDLGFGLVPFIAFAEIAQVEVPIARALVELGEALVGRPLREKGLNARRLGLEGVDRDGLLTRVRSRHRAPMGQFTEPRTTHP